MKKLLTWIIYLKNFLKLKLISIRCKGKLTVRAKQLIGKHSTVEVEKNGILNIEEKLLTRDNFHIKVSGGKCDIGEKCFFNYNCSITCLKKIKIGNRCTFGNNLVIVDHDHDIRGNSGGFVSKDIIIEDDVWVGANVVILKGVTLGEGCVIAAGTVVSKNVPSNMIFLGDRMIPKIART